MLGDLHQRFDKLGSLVVPQRLRETVRFIVLAEVHDIICLFVFDVVTEARISLKSLLNVLDIGSVELTCGENFALL